MKSDSLMATALMFLLLCTLIFTVRELNFQFRSHAASLNRHSSQGGETESGSGLGSYDAMRINLFIQSLLLVLVVYVLTKVFKEHRLLWMLMLAIYVLVSILLLCGQS
jgi:hypothetical protein